MTLNSETRLQTEWKGFKLGLPFLLVTSVLCVETTAPRLWLRDELFSWDGALRLLLMASLPFLILLLAFVIPLLLTGLLRRCLPFLPQGPGRRIGLDEKGVKLSQTKYDRVWWKHVRRWFVAPTPSEPRLVKLTLECGAQAKPGRRYWSILLESPGQKQAFLAEIDQLKQIGRTTAPVVELLHPLPSRPVSSAGLWAVALAFYLFIHGGPLLLTAVFPPGGDRSGAHRPAAEKAKLELLMRPIVRDLHISNERELRGLFGLTGGLLVAAAAGALVWGNRRQNRQAEAINLVFDSEVEKVAESLPPHHRLRASTLTVPLNCG